MNPHPATHSVDGGLLECFGERGTRAPHAGQSYMGLVAQERMRTPLCFRGEVAVFQAVASDALVPSSVVVIEGGEGKAGDAVHVHLAG